MSEYEHKDEGGRVTAFVIGGLIVVIAVIAFLVYGSTPHKDTEKERANDMSYVTRAYPACPATHILIKDGDGNPVCVIGQHPTFVIQR